MEASVEKKISECYKISENDVEIADTKEWAVARRAIDVAIFKAGQGESAGKIEKAKERGLETGKVLGRKEVVEWMMENYPEVCDNHLQAKLKEWEL